MAENEEQGGVHNWNWNIVYFEIKFRNEINKREGRNNSNGNFVQKYPLEDWEMQARRIKIAI